LLKLLAGRVHCVGGNSRLSRVRRGNELRAGLLHKSNKRYARLHYELRSRVLTG
jgi:hypothetical protein